MKPRLSLDVVLTVFCLYLAVCMVLKLKNTTTKSHSGQAVLLLSKTYLFVCRETALLLSKTVVFFKKSYFYFVKLRVPRSRELNNNIY